MSISITHPTNVPTGDRHPIPVTFAEQANPISRQAPVAAALLALTEMFGGLPAGYVTMHSTGDLRLGLHLDTPAEFEAWRSALVVPSDDVELKEFDGSTWLAADGLFRGVSVHLTGYGIEVPTAPERAA